MNGPEYFLPCVLMPEISPAASAISGSWQSLRLKEPFAK